MSVPHTFGSATGTLSLSDLDDNFSTAITLGSTALTLGATVTSVSGLALVAPSLGTPSTLDLTNATGLPLASGITGTLAVANGGTGVTTITGTGSAVLSAGPTFTGTLAGDVAAFTGAVSGASLSVSGDVTGASLNGGQLAGRRNRIINGGFGIDQRNSGASQTITTSSAYTVDRWLVVPVGASVTGQRIAGTAPSQYRYRITGAASVTSIALAQRIEAANCFDFAGKTVTISADLANSLLTSISWSLYYANTTDTFSAITIIASGTWTVTSSIARYTAQISVPSAATTGLQFVLTAGAQTSGTWTIGDAQIELGSVATPFEQELISSELIDCRRYYNVIPAGMRGDGYLNSTGATAGICATYLPMRTSPTSAATWTTQTNISNGPFLTNANGVLYASGNSTAAGQYSIILSAVTMSAEL